MARHLSLDAVLRLQATAIQWGGKVTWTDKGTVSPTRTVEWSVAGYCEQPVTLEIVGKRSAHMRAVQRGEWTFLSSSHISFARVILDVECRKCLTCRRKRAAMWRQRAQAEFSMCVRNWFGTLTFPSSYHFQMTTILRVALAKRGVDYDALSGTEQFNERVKLTGKEVTLWLKRIRKNNGAAPLRYLLVAEEHMGAGENRGFPHFHILLHEVDFARPYRKALLQSAWPHGFTNFKLASDFKSASYLTKYISKQFSDARVRASLNYGSGSDIAFGNSDLRYEEKRGHLIDSHVNLQTPAAQAGEVVNTDPDLQG